MLVDFQYLNNSKQLCVSYVDESGSIKLKYFSWEIPYKYETCDASDPSVVKGFKSWDGKPIRRVNTDRPDRYSVYEFLDTLPDEEREEIFKFNEPNTYFIDIETDRDKDGYSKSKDARCPIISISIIHKNKIYILGLKDLSEHAQNRIKEKVNKYLVNFKIEYDFKYHKFNSEYDMLKHFFELTKKMPCITGWNFIDYDWRYLVNRARKLTKVDSMGVIKGIDPRVSSPTNRLETVFGTEYELPIHRIVHDYMLLYKTLDTSVKIKESNTLDFVANSLLGVKKIAVTDKDGKSIDLSELYESDFEQFIYYNTIDSALVQLIHNKMSYISILYAISTTARIKLSDVYSHMNKSLGTLAITEGVLRDRFRKFGIIVFKDKNADKKPSSITGGWVKSPIVGLNEWVACYDFSSLYPTVQRQFFIAPENLVGKVDLSDRNYCIDTFGNRVLIDKNIHVVCVNDVVFKKVYSPTIQMLTDLFGERKKFKNIMLDNKILYDKLKHKFEDTVKKTLDEASVNALTEEMENVKKLIDYNNAMQQAIKLVLNGSYGAFANNYFVIYNEYVAATITACGRELTSKMSNLGSKYWKEYWSKDTALHKRLHITDVEELPESFDPSVYSDTDSCFVSYNGAIRYSNWKDKLFNEKFINSFNKPFMILSAKLPFEIDNKHFKGYLDINKLDNKAYNIEDDIVSDTKYIIIDSFYLKFKQMKGILSNTEKYTVLLNIKNELDYVHCLDYFRIANYYKKCLEEHANIYNVKNIQDFELEKISESIINLEKKKYIQHIRWEDGVYYDRLKYLQPKGVDIVRSSTPKFVRGDNGILAIVKYIFDRPKDNNIKDIIDMLKSIKEQMQLSEPDDISGQSSCSKYIENVVSDRDFVEVKLGTHFAVKAAAFHNMLLYKKPELVAKYIPLTSGDKVKYYYCTSDSGHEVFAYRRGSYPIEFAPPVNWTKHFEIFVLNPINKIITSMNHPRISDDLKYKKGIFNFKNFSKESK